MKLSDIKGSKAITVNKVLFTKFEEYLNGFILTLPEEYNFTIKQEHSNPGEVLFESNKRIKDFLSKGNVKISKDWFGVEYDDLDKLKDDVKALGITGYGDEALRKFKFEDKYFSGNIRIYSVVEQLGKLKDCGLCYIDFLNHYAEISLRIKDKDALMKELDQELENRSKLKCAGVSISLDTSKKKEIESLVDQIFKEFSNPEDNVIALWAINHGLDWDKDEVPVYNLNPHCINYRRYLKTVKKRNPFYYPIGTGATDERIAPWEIDNIPEGYEELTEKLRELCLSVGVKDASSYYDGVGIPSYWAGVIGITKDYRVVSYIIRYDGLLLTRRSMDYTEVEMYRDRDILRIYNHMNRAFNKIITTL